jgi:hypothetical protein
MLSRICFYGAVTCYLLVFQFVEQRTLTAQENGRVATATVAE